MKPKAKITTVIVAKNEAKNISDAIKSVLFTDEVIVVDNMSTDNTAEISKLLGAKVVRLKGDDFSKRKNDAARIVGNQWILFLDADERVPKELSKEIKDAVSSDLEINAYAMPRNNIIFGKLLKRGGLSPDFVIRLIKKNEFTGFKNRLHEQPGFRGKLGYFKSPLTHIKHNNIHDMVEKTNVWSNVEAELMYKASHPPMNIIRFTTAGLREFHLRMIKQMAFLDGINGIIYGLYQVYSRLVSYSKLWEMQINKEKTV